MLRKFAHPSLIQRLSSLSKPSRSVIWSKSTENKEIAPGIWREPAPTNKPQIVEEWEASKLERHEIEARLYKVLRDFQKISLNTFKWEKSNISTDLKLDSLERINLITGIEHEFKTLFTDNVFESFESVEDIVVFLEKDRKIL